jgi:hypothetical protein
LTPRTIHPNITDGEEETALSLIADREDPMEMIYLLLDYGSSSKVMEDVVQSYEEAENRSNTYMDIRYSDISIRWI